MTTWLDTRREQTARSIQGTTANRRRALTVFGQAVALVTVPSVGGMEAPEDVEIRCENEVEDDRDGAAEPALAGSPGHADGVASDHRARVDVAEHKDAFAQPRPRLHRGATSERKLSVDPAHQAEDRD